MATVAGMNLYDIAARTGEHAGRGLRGVLDTLLNQFAMQRLGGILEGGVAPGMEGDPMQTYGFLSRILRDPWMSPQVKQYGISLAQSMMPEPAEPEGLEFLKGEDQYYGVGKETGRVQPTGVKLPPTAEGQERLSVVKGPDQYYGVGTVTGKKIPLGIKIPESTEKAQSAQRKYINAINVAMAPYAPDQSGISIDAEGNINLGGFKNKYNELQRVIDDPNTTAAARAKARKAQRNVDHWINQVSNIAGQAPEEAPAPQGKGGRKSLEEIWR
jgi:hypothetical protein